jgi:glyoxylase-like metal-dependent hydrolase (beta-lactamase superfamily II)
MRPTGRPEASSDRTPERRITAMVQRWDLITIGNLSRNRYWGESEARACRPAICTCTLVRTDAGCLLVDPSLEEEERMAAELDRRVGLRLADIDAVFLTHEHGDHHFGLRHFPNARWLAAPPVAERLNGEGRYEKRIEPTEGPVMGSIELVPTPGHTLTHHSLRFDCDGLSVVIAADAAMTRDFWRERQGYFNSADFALAAQSVEKLAQIADIIVPGHDNYFLTRR